MQKHWHFGSGTSGPLNFGGQVVNSRTHEAEARFRGMAEASFSSPLG